MATKRPDFITAAKRHVKTEPVEFPDFGQTVYARALSRAEMRRLSETCLKDGMSIEDGDEAIDNLMLTTSIIAASIVDDKGKRVFPEGEEQALDELPNLVAVELQRAAFRVNGMQSEEGQEAEEKKD